MSEIFAQRSQPLVDQRQAAFTRLVARIIETLNSAVERRKLEGQSNSEIAERIGCHRTALSRTLNGTTRNITLKTISDVLWATDFEARDFQADAIEDICDNWISYKEASDVASFTVYTTHQIDFSHEEFMKDFGTALQAPEIELVSR